jgi:hypothetical protein
VQSAVLWFVCTPARSPLRPTNARLTTLTTPMSTKNFPVKLAYWMDFYGTPSFLGGPSTRESAASLLQSQSRRELRVQIVVIE